MSDDNRDESKRSKLPQIVLRALIDGGSTMEELASRKNLKNMPVGDPDQIQHQSKSIWHSKPEIDAYVREKLDISDAEWNTSDSNRPSFWFTYVAQEISKLRKDGTITDWNPELRTGIWRLTHLKGISSVEPTVEPKIAICWPTDKLESKIEDFAKVINNHGKVLWGVNWGLNQVATTDYPITGYIYFKKEIVAIAKISDCTKYNYEPSDEELQLRPTRWHISETYSHYLHIIDIQKCDPFPHKKLELMDSSKTIPDVIQQRVYVKEVYYDIKNNVDMLDKDPEIKLPMLSTPDIEEGYDLISKDLLIPKEKIIEIVTALLSGRHILLAGPIGTGKTELARLIPKIFWKRWGGYDSEVVTANSEWSTLDVLAGILPKMEGGEPKYVIEPGCVVDTVRKNSKIHTTHSKYSSTPYMGTWLVIDEFNRANIDKAFGQLFTALRTYELKIPTDKINVKYDYLSIQKDYRIIGTLNTADKHHLFNLSDALKSRFAYIELDIPTKGQREREIYFTMNNAIKELDLDESKLKIFLVLDHNNKKIDKRTNDKFYDRIFEAYAFLDVIRIFKKLGPAVLKLIFQNLVTGVLLQIDNKTTLDNALTSTLIPQLENLESSSIGAIHAMHTDTLDSFFKDAYKDLNKLNYVETFKKVLIYLNISDEDKIISKFENDTLPNDDVDWITINVAFNKKKENIAIKLEQLSSALLDLKESMII